LPHLVDASQRKTSITRYKNVLSISRRYLFAFPSPKDRGVFRGLSPLKVKKLTVRNLQFESDQAVLSTDSVINTYENVHVHPPTYCILNMSLPKEKVM